MIDILKKGDVIVRLDFNDYEYLFGGFKKNNFWLSADYIFPLKSGFVNFSFVGKEGVFYRVRLGDFSDEFYGSKDFSVSSDVLEGMVEMIIEEEGKFFGKVSLAFVNYGIFVYLVGLIRDYLFESLGLISCGRYLDNDKYLEGFESYIKRFGFSRWSDVSFEDFRNYVKEWVESYLKRSGLTFGVSQLLGSIGYISLLENKKNLFGWLLGYHSYNQSNWVKENV